MSMCDYEMDPFLKTMVAENEKWIVFHNFKSRRPRTKPRHAPSIRAKLNLHPTKILLSIWWDWKGIIYYELLPKNQTINSEKYCSQLNKTKNWPERAWTEKTLCCIRAMVDRMCFWRPSTNFFTLVEMFWFIHCILLALHPLTIIYLYRSKRPYFYGTLLVKTLLLWDTWKIPPTRNLRNSFSEGLYNY